MSSTSWLLAKKPTSETVRTEMLVSWRRKKRMNVELRSCE